MIPGSNILAMANRVISPQLLLYKPFVARTKNAAGTWVTARAFARELLGNIQPVPRQRYEHMGLDFQKEYAMIYIQKNVLDIARDVTGDQFWYAGRLFQAESRTDWFAQDGWEGILCVVVPGYTPPFPKESDEECPCDA